MGTVSVTTSSASLLAIRLDNEMIARRRGSRISEPHVPDRKLRARKGADVAKELGGRWLVRYLLPGQVGNFRNGATDLQFTTPTPLTPDETLSHLALPGADPRTWHILLDPAQIDTILGPRRVRGGTAVEYLLPNGFSKKAMIVKWPLEVR